MFCPQCGEEFSWDVTGPAEFWVRAEDAESARVLLEGLTTPSEKPASER